jgi:thiamine biosynthesis lipoprotein
VDVMGDVLEEWDLPSSLVHGGFSSVLALDAPAGQNGWPLTLSDPAEPSRVFERLTARQTALGASGVRKRDHIVDPLSGVPVRARQAAWVTLPRPREASAEPAAGLQPRAAAVADALTTACMMLGRADIEALCRHNAGLQVWILEETKLRHFGAAASERSERASGAE